MSGQDPAGVSPDTVVTTIRELRRAFPGLTPRLAATGSRAEARALLTGRLEPIRGGRRWLTSVVARTRVDTLF